MLPASYNCKVRYGRSAAPATDGSRLQLPLHGAGMETPAGVTFVPSLVALLRSAAARSGSTPQPARGHPAAAALNDLLQPPLTPPAQQQLQWPDSNSASSSSSAGAPASEALRPRRFSAPVIARLLRSTTSLQALADVVQQQSPYMDIPLVTVALLHMALLFSRQQRQPPTTVRDATATTAAAKGAGSSSAARSVSDSNSSSRSGSSSVAGSSISSSNGNGNGNGSGHSVAGPAADVPAAGVAAGVAAAGSHDDVVQMMLLGVGPEGYEDDGLPLQMASLLDDDDDEDDHHVHDVDDALLLIEGQEGTRPGVLSADRSGDSTSSSNGSSSSTSNGSSGGGGGGGGGSSGGAGLVALAAPAEAGTSSASAAVTGSASGGTRAPPGPPAAPAAIAATSESPPVPAAAATTTITIAGTSTAAAAGPPVAAAASSSPAASALRILVPMVLSSLDSVSGSDLSKVLSALAVLRYDNKVVVEQLLQVMSLKLVECSSQELSSVVVSLATLGVPPDPYVRSNIYSAVKYQSRRFGPRDLALTIWAYGAMGTDVQEDAVLVLLEASRPKLSTFSPLHLAKAAQGLAALRYRPPPEWVAAYCEALRPALRRTSSRELCAVLLALADLQVSLDDATRAMLLVHTLTRLPSLEPPELALSIWALGRLTAGGLPALIDLDTSARVLDVTLARLRSGAFTGGELQQLLEGITRLALQPPLEWMQTYVAALQPHLALLEPRQLAGVLGSLAAQQYRPEPEMQGVVMAATQANMRQLLSDTTSTASLLTALRRLNIEPPAAWVAALLEASRSALKNRCTDLHLANMAGALAAWGVRPDGRWAARLMWRSQVLMQQGRMSPRALVALLQAMSALGLRPNPVWTDLCLYTAASRSAQPDFEPQHFSTLLPALHALGVKPPQDWLCRMMLSMYRCWDRFNVTHWSSMLPALVLLRAAAPTEWLQRLQEVLAPRLPDCSALQLLTLLVATSQLRGLGLQALKAAAEPTTAAAATATAAAAAAGAGNDGGEAAGGAALFSAATPPPPAGAPAGSSAPDPIAAGTSPHRHHHNGHPPTAWCSTGGSASGDFSSGSSASGDVPSPSRARNLRTARRRQRQLAGLSASEALPSGPWLAAWWAASGSLLGRVRYAPSELLLTASWLVSLGMRPPPEWLEACIDVSQRYSKVMAPAEQAQLAAAMMPLAAWRENRVANKQHSSRRPPPAAAAVAVAAPAAAAGPDGASGPVAEPTAGTTERA